MDTFFADAGLAAVEAWFAARDWAPFAFQREVWAAYLRGESGLIHAATGTGKTYAAWLGPVAEALAGGRRSGGAEEQRSRGGGSSHADGQASLRILWITPLRALAADTAQALEAPLAELGLRWTVETRTGDTEAKVRARQRRRLPEALVTTPESLSLLLAREDAGALFAGLRCVVVDEWHELMASKRGVQAELALARLRRWRPGLRVWGLSATLGNLDAALEALLGVGVAGGRLIQGEQPKAIELDSLIPATVERFPWAGHLGLRMLPQVLAEIEAAQSCLVFTNTRAQTERWYQAILDARPAWAGQIALHHGSLSREVREWVEGGLRDGRLRCVVCTSSLDLGVDFSPVERVLQVGSPKGVARLLQRAGRSGHRPGAPSRATCVPTHAFELVEAAAVRRAALAGQIEARPPVEKPLDVLAQHLVTVALGGGFRAGELLAEVRTARAYAALADEEWRWCLDFVVSGGGSLGAYPEYRRVVEEGGVYRVADEAVARRHRQAIGTITADAAMVVQYVGGEKLGSVEEAFIARLSPGDKFAFAGRVLEFVRVREMTAWVRKAKGVEGAVPRWTGGRLPLSSELAAAVRERLQAARDGVFEDPELVALRPILALQARWSRIPGAGELLVERTKTRDGHHLFVYPFEGRLVHEGLAALLAYRLARATPITFTVASNDYGLELLSAERAPVDGEADLRAALSPAGLVDDIHAAMNAAELARRQFREIARVAGLVVVGPPHERRSARQLQASSNLFYDVFQQYDPQNLLLRQARREVLERQLEGARLAAALERLAAGAIVIVETPRPTPLAFPLLVDRLRERVSSEQLADRVRKMQLQLERAAG
jgi:ATP-dependent Lhr-like helicase